MDTHVDYDPREDAYSKPLDKFDVSDPKLYQDDVWYPYFERLRREAPVHWCRESLYGPYWSVSKYKDIMQVEVNHQTYSSELGGIAVEDQPKGLERESFIRMDPPKHDEPRKGGQPDCRATEPRRDGSDDPRADGPGAQRAAARRDLRLGGVRLDRADGVTILPASLSQAATPFARG